MKSILFVALLLPPLLAHAQTDKKPSWSQDMPDRKDAPTLKIDNDSDSDLGGFGLDRSELLGGSFNDEYEENSEDETINEKERLAADQERINARLAEIKQQEEKQALAKKKSQQLAQEKLKQEQQEQQAQDLANQQELEQAKRLAEKEEIQKRESKKKAKQIPASNANYYTWKKIKNVAPNYPSKAARDKREGWVDVEVVIAPSGKVIGAHVIKSSKNSKLFNNESLKAVRKWSYEPPIDSGVQTNLKKTVRLVFKL